MRGGECMAMSFTEKLAENLNERNEKLLKEKRAVDNAENDIIEWVTKFKQMIEKETFYVTSDIHVEFDRAQSSNFASINIYGKSLFFKRAPTSIGVYKKTDREDNAVLIDELFSTNGGSCVSKESGAYLRDFVFDQYMEKVFSEIMDLK